MKHSGKGYKPPPPHLPSPISHLPSPISSLLLKIIQSFALQHTAYQTAFHTKPISGAIISAYFSLFIFLSLNKFT